MSIEGELKKSPKISVCKQEEMRVNIKKNIYVTLRQAQQQQQPVLKANVQKGYVNFGSDVDSNDDSSTNSALMNDIMGEYGNHDERQTAKEREWWE